MFLCSISRSIVGPSVIDVYSNSNPSFGIGTSIDDIPPGQFNFYAMGNFDRPMGHSICSNDIIKF
jgi:hypothetical protein